MKKLVKKEMCKVKGGAPPYCVRICTYEYQFCLTSRAQPKCQQERTECIECECNNVCL